MKTLRIFFLKRKARRLFREYWAAINALEWHIRSAEEMAPSLARKRREAKAALIVAFRLQGVRLSWRPAVEGNRNSQSAPLP